MARQRPKSHIVLDWFTVSYRSVLLFLGALALMALVVVFYFLYFASDGRGEAAAAIARAQSRLSEAASYPPDSLLDEIRASAGVALGEAKSRYDDRHFEDARLAAVRSENLSQKAIDLARGEADTKQVRFYRLEGDVRVKRAGAFNWEPADRRMVLRLGDQVKTSSSASAQLLYFDGTVTTIHPGSLLEIRDLYEDPATRVRKVREKLSWGEVVASFQKRNVEGSYHEVATDRVSARAVDHGELRVSYDREKKTAAFDVFKGKVEVASPDRRESLIEGERIQASSDGRLSAKKTLPAAPRLVAPSDQRVFVHDDPTKERTTLSWEAIPGAARYHLMIADGSLFTDPLYDDEATGTSVVIEGIAAGAYYWKVAAIGAGKTEGPFSAPRHFRVTSRRIRDREDETPPELEITEFVQTGPMVIFNGRTEPGALLWVDNEKIDVYEDGSFYAVIRLRKEGNNEIVLLAQDAAGNTTRTVRQAYVETY